MHIKKNTVSGTKEWKMSFSVGASKLNLYFEPSMCDNESKEGKSDPELNVQKYCYYILYNVVQNPIIKWMVQMLATIK